MEIQQSHILIVDDNINNLQLVARILKDNSYRISLAQSGSVALAQIDEIKPDLILLDIMMPDMDGIEVCRLIKNNQNWVDIPILFLTAKSQSEDLVQGFQAGGVDYITKPFNQEELLVRVKNHIELAKSRNTILELNHTRDKLYSIIAHDLRSPLASIIMTIDMLASGDINPNQEELIELFHMLGESARNTNNLLSNLLEWTKFQSGKLHADFGGYNLCTLLFECTELLKSVAANKNITIKLEVDHEISAWIDETMMHTVFRNIISNAIKFSPQGGTITITSQKDKDSATVSIADTGVGMSEQVIDKIFVQKEQHTSMGTNSEQGTGLGLLMVKDFVQKNNGALQVSSALGQGTRFDIVLPANPKIQYSKNTL